VLAVASATLAPVDAAESPVHENVRPAAGLLVKKVSLTRQVKREAKASVTIQAMPT
jgi:hypothetical protein